MTEVWATIAALCVGTVAIKATGPLALGGRQPGERTFAVVSLFAPALLAALVVYETLSDGHDGLAVALIGGAITLSLMSFVPAGLAVIAASLAALIGLRRS